MSSESKNGIIAGSSPTKATLSPIASWSVALALPGLMLAGLSAPGDEIVIDSLEELAAYAKESGNQIRMEAGLYHMTDYISLDRISNRKAEGK